MASRSAPAPGARLRSAPRLARVAVVAVAALFVIGLASCATSTKPTVVVNGYDANAAKNYSQTYQVLYTEYRNNPGLQEKVRISSYIHMDPGFPTPDLSVYVNCCYQNGTGTMTERHCSGQDSCYTEWFSNWWNWGDHVACHYNGNAYIWSTAKYRTYICDSPYTRLPW